jgi:hypothetical protein
MLLTVLLLVSLASCKTDDTDEKIILSYDNIFVQQLPIVPYSNAEVLLTLDEGVQPYLNAAGNYDDTYIAAYGLVILQRTVIAEGSSASMKYYGFYSLSAQKVIIPVDYVEFTVGCGFISVRAADGKCLLYNVLGEAIFSVSDGFVSTTVDGSFLPISTEYIAVRAGGGNYFNIYDKTGKILTKSDGSPLKYAGKLTELRATGEYFSRTEVATSTAAKKITIYKIGDSQPLVTFTGETLASNVNAFYLGNGKFYCYDIYAGSAEGYQYKVDDQYFKATVWTYDAISGERKTQSLDTVFVQIINSYYAEEEGLSLDIDAYVKEGYSFVSSAYTRDGEKNATFDQFIIDSDLNILLSMSSQLGTNVVYNADNEAYRDVLLTYVDDVGFSATSVGELLLYDLYGNVVFRRAGVYTSAFYNSGIVTALVAYDEGGENKYYACAFDLSGKEIFNAYDRKYAVMTPYVGNFALAETYDGRGNKICVLVDKQGEEHPVQGTLATTTNGRFIYKPGCYAVKETVGNATYYTVKSYDGTNMKFSGVKSLVMSRYGTNTIVVYTTDVNGRWSISLLK